MSAARAEYGTSSAYPGLPSGRHPLPREYVDQYQRRRLVVAVAELAHEEGVAGVTVSALASRARISRKTFYDYFGNREACVDYAAEEAAAFLFEPIAGGEDGQSPDQKIATSVGALLEAVAAEPKLAELPLVHAPALGGERGRRFQEVAIQGIWRLLGSDVGSEPSGRETIASAIIGVIACHLRRGGAERAVRLADEVVRLAQLPAVEEAPSRGGD